MAYKRRRRVLRRPTERSPGQDTPERRIEAFEWFPQQLGALRTAERRKRPAGDRPVLP